MSFRYFHIRKSFLDKTLFEFLLYIIFAMYKE